MSPILDEAAQAFYRLVKWLPYEPSIGVRKIAAISGEVVPVEAAEWLGYVRERFPKLEACAETCMSVVCQLLINDVRNPFALIIVDDPASGKTITINFFKGIEELTYYTSDFSPASFVSNIAGKSEKQLERIDLLPKIRYKTFLIKDLAPIMSDNDDVLKKRMGMMIDILDGEGYTTQSGVYGNRGYDGDYLFMMIAAATPFAPRVWKIMSEYGPRIFFLGLHSPQTTKEELIAQLRGVNYKVKEHECKVKTHQFLRHMWKKNANGVQWEIERDEPEVMERLAEFALFLANFRGDIYVHEERSSDGRVLAHSEPRIEKASRINQCLYNLCRGHAVWNGRNFVTKDDIGTAFRVLLDSAPNPRPKLLRLMLQNGGKLTVTEVIERLGVSKNTAKKEMHKLVQLGVCLGDIEREAEDNSWGIPVAPAGQAKTTITLRQEFSWLKDDPSMYEREWNESVVGWKARRE